MAQVQRADDPTDLQVSPVSMSRAHTSPRELAMSAAWNGALQRQVATTAGVLINVVYHGTWSHGFGPDFTGAMLDAGDAKLITGDVEIHNRTSEWYDHRHHLDSNYNNVVLHVVRIDDAPPVRCLNGRVIPTAVLNIADEALLAIDRQLPAVWAELGGSVCAEKLSTEQPQAVLSILHALGDQRFQAKSTGYQSDILEKGLAPVFVRALFGGFGYSANRAPMEHLADLVLRYHILENPRLQKSETPDPWLVGVLLGLGGFLPLAPSDAHAAGILPEDQFRIEREWVQSAPGFAHDFVPAISWQTARVRPANHPAYRIMQLATLIARSGSGLAEDLLDTLRAGDDAVTLIQDRTMRPWHPGLGRGRATAIVASVLLPNAHAYALTHDDAELEDAALRTWASLRHADWTQPAKRALTQVTGGPSLRGLGERGHQGLLYLDRELCAPRKCKQCPIAHAVIKQRST